MICDENKSRASRERYFGVALDLFGRGEEKGATGEEEGIYKGQVKMIRLPAYVSIGLVTYLVVRFIFNYAHALYHLV